MEVTLQLCWVCRSVSSRGLSLFILDSDKTSVSLLIVGVRHWTKCAEGVEGKLLLLVLSTKGIIWLPSQPISKTCWNKKRRRLLFHNVDGLCLVCLVCFMQL